MWSMEIAVTVNVEVVESLELDAVSLAVEARVREGRFYCEDIAGVARVDFAELAKP
jgi:hypothetical protein